MNTVPYSYQIADVRKIRRMGGRTLLSWSMGLGKSLAALMYMQRSGEGAYPAVIICPASLKYQWENEAAKHMNMRVDVIGGKKAPAAVSGPVPKLTVVNYDVLGAWIPYLKSLNPKLIVIDEAHYLANRSSQRTKNVRALCQGVPHVIALTGTPLVNRPSDLWPTLNVVRPDLFPSFWPFAMDFCAPKRTRWGWDLRGASNLDRLHEKMSLLMIRRRKEDVLSQLPPKVRNVVPVELSDRREYDEASEEFLAWLAKKDYEKARRAAFAETVTRLGYLKRLAGKLKLNAVTEWVDNFLADDGGKIILFAVHKEVISHLRSKYANTCVVVDGSVSARDRQAAVDKFQKCPGVRVFVGNIKAAGVGLNLTAASAVTFAEVDWVPGAHAQAEDRAHRIGQGGTVFVTYLVAENTVEEYLVEILGQKQNIICQVIDGGEADTDTFDRLVARMKQSKWRACK